MIWSRNSSQELRACIAQLPISNTSRIAIDRHGLLEHEADAIRREEGDLAEALRVVGSHILHRCTADRVWAGKLAFQELQAGDELGDGLGAFGVQVTAWLEAADEQVFAAVQPW